MKPDSLWSDAARFHELLDLLSDPVLVLDRQARIGYANSAALRALLCEAGMPLDQLRDVIGAAAVQWAQRCVASLRHVSEAGPAPAVLLPDGRHATLAWQPLDEQRSALRLQVAPLVRPSPAEPGPARASEILPASAALIRLQFESPFPATVQDASFRLVDVNPAFCEFLGYAREQLIGVDPFDMIHPDDQPLARAHRQRLTTPVAPDRPALGEFRLIDASRRYRSYRVSSRALVDGEGTRWMLSQIQDTSAEWAAREHADRSARELDQWFDLSPIGMVLFDDAGLVVRTNDAFDAFTEAPPALLSEASEPLRELLTWRDGAPSSKLGAGQEAVSVEGWLVTPDGVRRRMRSSVRCYTTPGGQRRFMAVVEDRTAEEERDLARVQVGAMMDTAGAGIATFQEASGWVRQPPTSSGEVEGKSAVGAAALQAIGRDVVVPSSLPAYERLQAALRQAERAEVRYAIRHGDLGERWLLTRVEPATLASGARTTSVVTLDVTEHQQAEARRQQLLHEMSTILESSTAGIASIRDELLVRCNRRFETMLGLGPHSAGKTLAELFGTTAQGQRIAADSLQALADGVIYETEFELTSTGESSWYALSVRRTGEAEGPIEAIAVLSDITRLKTQQAELERLARDRELMFSLSEVGIAFIREDRIQRANDALAQLSGFAAAELSDLPLAALFPDATEHAQMWAHEEFALRQFGRSLGERRMKRRDGRLIWVQVSKRLVVEGDPAGGIIASYVNVDDRHRAEQAVALQAERTRAILDSVLVGIVTVGGNGIEWMNRSARRMFGGDLADFISLPISSVATDEPDHPFRRTQYLDELIEGQAETFECRVRARDGREFWIVGNAVATGRESSGRQLTYALLDIQRRREAEARTAEMQHSLQRIIEAAPMGIVLRDAASLRIVQINRVAAGQLGRTPAELVGALPEDIFPADMASVRRSDMEHALALGAATQVEYRRRRRSDETERIWDVRYMPLAATGAASDQLLMVASDVTEQRAVLEARFEAALAQREMLVKEVHHRIKNNLQGVAGLLQQIAQRKPEVAGAMSEVVGQVQAIAQVYGLQVGVTGPLRLKNVVEAITGSVQKTFGFPLELGISGPAPERWALPESESIPIALTLNELLTNAIKHSRGGEQHPVDCRLECHEDRIRLTIANHGRLPEGFSLQRFPGGVSGLGLVRSLLPRRHARLTLEQRGDEVLAVVELDPPTVSRLDSQ